MLKINNNLHSAQHSISKEDGKESFEVFLNWCSPMKIIISTDSTDPIDYSELFDAINTNQFYFSNKHLNKILPFLRLEFNGIGTLMHFLVWSKHFSTNKNINLSIKYIEEKCEQELSAEEKERYLFVKNSEGLTYKELDQKLQDEKIKSISFNIFQQNLQNVANVSDRNRETPCDAQILVDLCKKGQIDSPEILLYRADRTDDGDSPLFFVGDTLLNIAARLYLRGQIASNFIYRLFNLAYENRIFKGNRFLKDSSIVEKITKSERKPILKIYNMAAQHFAIILINTLCQKNLSGSTLYPNLSLLSKIQINNENFFHFYVRKFWQECSSLNPEAFGNVFNLLKNLKDFANSKWNPLSKICQSILEYKNSYGNTLETLHCELSRAAASLQTEQFLSVFFSCPETIDDQLLFDFRIDKNTPWICGQPTYKGDTLLHIAFRLYRIKNITKDFLEKIIDRALFANKENGRFFLEAKIKDVEWRSFANTLLINSLMKLFNYLHLRPFEEFKEIFLRNLDLINDRLVAKGRLNPLKEIDFIYKHAKSKFGKRNFPQMVQLLKEQIEQNTKYAEPSKKFLEFKDKGISFLCYSKTQQHLYPPAKIRLSAWESMLITSFTEEAREQLADSPNRQIIANLMKKAQETRRQKISQESNSLVEEKFIRKLKNSIKKLP